MAETTLSNILVLTFNDGEKDRRLKIPDPREDLAGKEVLDTMKYVADTHFIWRKNVTPKSAKIVKTATDQIDITVD